MSDLYDKLMIELMHLQDEHTVLHREQTELTGKIIENQKKRSAVIVQLHEQRKAGLA